MTKREIQISCFVCVIIQMINCIGTSFVKCVYLVSFQELNEKIETTHICTVGLNMKLQQEIVRFWHKD